NGAADVTIDHNTVFQAGPIIVVDDAPSTGFTYTNNIASEYQGVVGSGTGVGLPTLEFWFPGYVYARNVQPGGNPLVYPPDNFFPASLGDVGFVGLVGGDYHLATTSPYRNGGRTARISVPTSTLSWRRRPASWRDPCRLRRRSTRRR